MSSKKTGSFLTAVVSMSVVAMSACGNLEAATSETAAPQAAATAAPAESDDLYIPVRMSRAFFEKQLTGEIRILDAQGNAQDSVQSPVSYRDLPPSAPAPTEPVLADFRDHLGCASFDAQGSLALCFNIQPDVSSVDLDGRSLSVLGASELLDRNCGAGEKSLEFVKAERNAETAKVLYKVKAAAGSQCASSGTTVEFTLRAS